MNAETKVAHRVEDAAMDEKLHMLCIVCNGTNRPSRLPMFAKTICSREVLSVDWLRIFRGPLPDRDTICKPCLRLYGQHPDRCPAHKNSPPPSES